MWHYLQDLGKIYHEDPDTDVGFGWAGQGAGKNNPAMQDVKGKGPIPCGTFTIGKAYTHPHLGPVTMDLTPDPTNEMFGRDDFRIHGIAFNNPELSSEGCIVQRRPIRELIDASPDRRLQVLRQGDPVL